MVHIYCAQPYYGFFEHTYVHVQQEPFRFYLLTRQSEYNPPIDIAVIGADDISLIPILHPITAKGIILIAEKNHSSVKNIHHLSSPFRLKDFTDLCINLCKRNPNYQNRFDYGDLHIDFSKKLIAYGDIAQTLTETELALLIFLLDRQNQIISKETLLSSVWNMTADLETHLAQNTIYRLRGKLKPFIEKGILQIETLPMGYRIKTDALS